MTCSTASHGHQPRPLTKKPRLCWCLEPLLCGSQAPPFSPPPYYTESPQTHLPSYKAQAFARVRFDDHSWDPSSPPAWRMPVRKVRSLPGTWDCPARDAPLGPWRWGTGTRGHTGNLRPRGSDRAWESAPWPAPSTSAPSPPQQAGDELLGTAETGGKWHCAEAEQGL